MQSGLLLRASWLRHRHYRVTVCGRHGPKTIAKAALYLSTSQVPLYDLSTGPESGWRPLNVKRVAELAEVILKGDFGNTVLGKPSVLCGHDRKARRMGLFVESWFCSFAESHYGTNTVSSFSRNQPDN